MSAWENVQPVLPRTQVQLYVLFYGLRGLCVGRVD
jgi:hypothetical protein